MVVVIPTPLNSLIIKPKIIIVWHIIHMSIHIPILIIINIHTYMRAIRSIMIIRSTNITKQASTTHVTRRGRGLRIRRHTSPLRSGGKIWNLGGSTFQLCLDSGHFLPQVSFVRIDCWLHLDDQPSTPKSYSCYLTPFFHFANLYLPHYIFNYVYHFLLCFIHNWTFGSSI